MKHCTAARRRTLVQLCGVYVCGSLLAACSLISSENRFSRAGADDFFAVSKERDWKTVKHGPLVHVANSGNRQDLDEVWYDNGYEQRVSYSGSKLTTKIKFSVLLGSDRLNTGQLTLNRPSKTGIEYELARLPEGDFRILRPINTKYGVMGVAASRHCVYAWQWLDDVRHLNTRLPSFRSGEMPSSLRILHCNEAGSQRDLLTDLEHFAISANAEPTTPHRPAAARPSVEPQESERPAPQIGIPSPDNPNQAPNSVVPRSPNGKQYLAPQSVPNPVPVPAPDDGKHTLLNFGKPVSANPLLMNGTKNIASQETPPPFGW